MRPGTKGSTGEVKEAPAETSMGLETPTNCQSVIDEHSSGAGMAQQVSFCIQAKCEAECLGG
jgi:hypothetical protein